MLVAIILLALSPLVLCDTPDRCCGPRKFSGRWSTIGAAINTTIGVENGTAKNNYLDTIYFDYDEEKMMLNRTSLMEGKPNYVFYFEYKTDVSYMVIGGRCLTLPGDPAPMIPQCIPANATYDGRHVMGSFDHHVPVDTWSYTLDNMDNELMVTPDCTKVAMKYVITKGERILHSVMTFLDMTPGVPAHIFDIPAMCHQ